MGSALMGSAPKANWSTQPTIDPTQQGLLSMLSGLLQTGQMPAGVQTYGGPQAGAPPGPDITGTLGAMQGLIGGGLLNPPTSTPSSFAYPMANMAYGGVQQGLGYTAPTIDATQAFQQGVVEPITQDFLQRTIPSIAGSYGAGAGGAYGSGQAQARGQAATDAERTLAEQGAKFAYSAAAANQQAALQAQQDRLTALGLTPQIAQIPGQANLQQTQQTQDVASILNQIFQAQWSPYAFAQGQMPTQWQVAQNTQQQTQQFISDLINAFSPQTQQTLGVGTGGTQGLLQGVLGSPALGAAVGALL